MPYRFAERYSLISNVTCSSIISRSRTHKLLHVNKSDQNDTQIRRDILKLKIWKKKVFEISYFIFTLADFQTYPLKY